MKNSAGKKKRFTLSSKAKKLLSYFFAVAVVILLVITAAQKLGNVTITTFTADVKTYFMSLGAGDGYPYEVELGTVKNIIAANSNLNVLTNDKTLVLTSSAKELQPENHSYSEPVMKAKGSRLIVYDLSSGQFRVQSSAGTTKEFELEQPITAAAISQKGCFAVATYNENAQTVLYSYSKSGEQEFTHNFGLERIIDMDISSNGKYLAAAAVSASNGEMNSKLYIINLNSDGKEYVAELDYPGTTLLKVNYVKGNNIVALGDNIRSYVKNNRERTDDRSFNSDKLNNYSVASNGSSTLLLSKYGSTSLSELTFYTNKNKEKYTQTFDREVKSISTDGSHTAVLFDGEVRTYNKKGKQVGTIYFNGDPQRVVIDGGTTYVLTSVSIKSFKTKGTTDERQAD